MSDMLNYLLSSMASAPNVNTTLPMTPDTPQPTNTKLPNPNGPPPVSLGPLVAPPPQQGATDLDGLTAVAPRNYDNSSAAIGAQRAAQENMQRAQAIGGGGPNQGIYGLLPQSWQHGTFRNILGALGDAFLVAGHRDPSYANTIASRAMGMDMAGYDKDPSSAVTRVAASGLPGSIKLADSMEQNALNRDIRTQMLNQQNTWREMMEEDRRNANAVRAQSAADRYQNFIGGSLLAGVDSIKDPALAKTTYGQKYNSLNPLAQRLGGKDATPASVFGLPDPDMWQPGMTKGWGQTATGQLTSQTSIRDTNTRAAATMGAAAANAGSRPPSTAGMITTIANKIHNGTATPQEVMIFNAYIQGHKNTPTLAPNIDPNNPQNNPGGARGNGGHQPSLQAGVTRMGGYLYMGGDPANPASWRK